MRRLPTVVTMVVRCLVDVVHVQTKDSAATGVQLCQNSSCLRWQCLFGCVARLVVNNGGAMLQRPN